MTRLTLAILCLVLFNCCSTNPEQENNPQQRLSQRLDSLVTKYVRQDDPGLQLLVAYDGEMVIAEAWGMQDIGNREPLTTSSNMRLGSVTKQFTALSILSLVEEGKLNLSDTLYSVFPYEVFREVTIEQMINHTSGIADGEAAFFNIWDPEIVATNQDLMEWYSTNPDAVFAPGTDWQYNNGAYEVLASVVAEVSGEKFADYAREHVFLPAGMKDTQFFDLSDPVEIKERSFCYEKDSTGTWRKVDGHFLNGLLGAGGLYSNVLDYFAYDQALRNRTLFSAETNDLIFQPSSMPVPGVSRPSPYYGNDSVYYAMGWNVSKSIATHGGGWFGTNTFTIRELDRPLTIAIFTNSSWLHRSGLTEELYKIISASFPE